MADGAVVNAAFLDGGWPLHGAAAARSADGVQALLAAGARPNVTAEHCYGNTAMHYIVKASHPTYHGRMEAALLALVNGANGKSGHEAVDVNLANDKGETPLHLAVPYPYMGCTTRTTVRVFTILLAAGARRSVDVLDLCGYTPLRKCLPIVDDIGAELATVLIRAGANVPALGSPDADAWLSVIKSPTMLAVIRTAMAWPNCQRCVWIDTCLRLGFAGDDAEY